MNKLIKNPYECGYCDIEENHRDNHCKHPLTEGSRVCDTTTFGSSTGTEFPINCPLPNGVIPYECHSEGEDKKEDCITYKIGGFCRSNLKQGLWCTGPDCSLYLKKG